MNKERNAKYATKQKESIAKRFGSLKKRWSACNWSVSHPQKGKTMADIEKVVNQLEIDIQRAERTGENLVYVGRKTAKDILSVIRELKTENEKKSISLRSSVSQGVVDQIKWERDTALSQLAEIGKGLGEKMDDVKALQGEVDRLIMALSQVTATNDYLNNEKEKAIKRIEEKINSIDRRCESYEKAYYNDGYIDCYEFIIGILKGDG